MGLDAEMYVASPYLLSDRDLQRLSYELGASFGPESFWIHQDPPQRALELCDLSERVLEMPFSGACTTFQVNLTGRYYGPGYERGDIILYLSLWRWFHSKLQDCVVWYGSDANIFLEILDEGGTEELWDHFVANGPFPYSQYRNSNQEVPNCPLCAEPMNPYSWNTPVSAVRCVGCGYQLFGRPGSWHTVDPAPS